MSYPRTTGLAGFHSVWAHFPLCKRPLAPRSPSVNCRCYSPAPPHKATLNPEPSYRDRNQHRPAWEGWHGQSFPTYPLALEGTATMESSSGQKAPQPTRHVARWSSDPRPELLVRGSSTCRSFSPPYLESRNSAALTGPGGSHHYTPPEKRGRCVPPRLSMLLPLSPQNHFVGWGCTSCRHCTVRAKMSEPRNHIFCNADCYQSFPRPDDNLHSLRT